MEGVMDKEVPQKKSNWSGLIARLCFFALITLAAWYLGFSKLFDFPK